VRQALSPGIRSGDVHPEANENFGDGKDENLGRTWIILEHIGTYWNILEHIGTYVSCMVSLFKMWLQHSFLEGWVVATE
jgi:hypothetical protein